MTGIAILLCCAAIGFGISKWLRVPVIPLLMLFGFLLGMSGVITQTAGVQSAMQLGLGFLVFFSGSELNSARFKPQGHAVPWVASIQLLGAGMGAFLLALAFGFRGLPTVYIALAVSASSTLVVVRHLKMNQQMFEPFGRLVLGVLLIQDIVIILAMAVLTSYDGEVLTLVRTVLGTIGLGAFAIICQRRLVPALFGRLNLDEESYLLSVLAVLFLFGGVAMSLGVPVMAGAFFAGLAFSGSPLNGVVRGLLASINDFFFAIFFTALGASVVVPDLNYLIYGVAFAFFVVVLTPPLVTIVAEWTGLPSRPAIESGLFLAQTSEFSVVLGLAGLYQGHISEDVFAMIALITVLTMTVTPFLATDRVTWWLLRFHPSRRRLERVGGYSGHILMVGFGTGGMWVLKPLLEAGHKVVVIDDDPVVVDQLASDGVICLKGDGSDSRMLEKGCARSARAIIAGTRRVSESEKILEYAKGKTVLVRTFEEQDAGRLAKLGGIPIVNSRAGANTFIEWFDKAFIPSAETSGNAEDKAE